MGGSPLDSTPGDEIKEDENQAVVDSKDSQNNQGSSGVKIMQHAFRALQKKEPDVQNKGSDCWYECGKRDGPCPHFCGKDGMCCQKGWPWGGCDGKIGPDNMHSCVEKIRDIDHGWIIADLNQNCHEACQKHNLQCTDDELRAHNEDVNTSNKVIKLILESKLCPFSQQAPTMVTSNSFAMLPLHIRRHFLAPQYQHQPRKTGKDSVGAMNTKISVRKQRRLTII